MPLGEIAGEFLGGAFRLLGRFLFELLFEILIKGLGYLICRPFLKSVDPDGALVTVIGFIAWVAIIIVAFNVYESISVQPQFDRCLDAGGRYQSATNDCEM